MSEALPNFHVLAGNPETGRLERQAYPGGPIELLRAGGNGLVELGDILVEVPAGVMVADAFKLSGVRNVRIGQLTVVAKGIVVENSWDCNRLCADVSVADAFLQEGRQNALTWKGGCRNFRIGYLTVSGRHGHCDLEAGNYSEQTREMSDGLRIERVDAANGPLRYRIGWARNVQILHGPTEYQVLPSLGLKAYVPLKQRLPFLP